MPETAPPSPGGQAAFAAALLDPDRPVPPGVTGPDGQADTRRFAVHRNNVTVSLIEALRATFPAIEHIVGEELFRHAARTFLRAHPPMSPVLAAWGDGFPAFLGGFAPTVARPWLGDVARLERLRLEAFHAEDAPPLDPARLGAVAPDRLADVRFRPHPALRLLSARSPVVTVWCMNADLLPVGPVDFGTHEDALVTRPDLEVEVRLLRPGAHAFLAALAGGATLGQAAAAGAEEDGRFDLSASLADALAAGAFAALDDDDERENLL